MSAKGATSMWKTVLQIALAVLLIVGGLSAFGLAKGSDALTNTVGSYFNGTLRTVVVYVLAAIEIIAGILLILDFFHIGAFDRLDDLFLLIVMLAWLVVFVVLGDIIPLIKGNLAFMPFLVALAKDCVVLSAMGIIKAKI